MIMKLKGKKIACFVGLPMHTRFFVPLIEKIREQGGDALCVVPLSEYPFEMDLLRRKLPFKYFSDYMTGGVKQKVKRATVEILSNWAKNSCKWDAFSRWPVFKQTWFFEGLIEEYFCMEKFIDVERPDIFMVLHECSRWGKTIGHLAWEKSIPFITFQEGDYHTEQMAWATHTEYSTFDLLWGERTIRFLRKFKCSADKMIPIGNMHIEGAIKEYGTPEKIALIKKELDVPPGKKVVLFFVDILYAGVGKKDEWQKILDGIDSLDSEAVCIFKWHPHTFMSAYEGIREVFKELYPSAIMLYTYEPYKLLAIADYCVTLGKTTLAVEALAFGKPLFSFPVPGEPEDMYASMGISRTMWPTPKNWSNLLDTIRNGVPADIQANVDKYVKDYFYKLDGRSIERTIEVMEYVLDVRKVERQAKTKVKAKAEVFTPGRVSFVIPSGDDPEAVLATLTSLSQNVKHPDWEIVIVVNHGAIKEILPGLSGDIKIVEHPGSVLSVLYNRGAEVSSGEFLVFMRPGIVYVKDVGMTHAMSEGITGIAIKTREDMKPYCHGIGFDYNFTPYFIKEENASSAGREASSAKYDAVGGGLIGMHRRIFNAVGGFDQEIVNHLIEADICLKAKETNIPIRYLPDCLAVNYMETFFGQDISNENWRGRVRFFAKWIGKLPKDDDFLSFAGDLLKV